MSTQEFTEYLYEIDRLNSITEKHAERGWELWWQRWEELLKVSAALETIANALWTDWNSCSRVHWLDRPTQMATSRLLLERTASIAHRHQRSKTSMVDGILPLKRPKIPPKFRIKTSNFLNQTSLFLSFLWYVNEQASNCESEWSLNEI